MIPDDIFSRSVRRARLARATRADPADRWLLEHMAEETLTRLSAVHRPFPTALILGVPLPSLVDAVRTRGTALPAQPVLFDEDRLPFADDTFDLVIANGALDSVNDLPGALLLIRRALRPDGLFLGAMLGAGSLPAARRAFADEQPATRRFHPLVDLRGMGDLMLRAGYFQPVIDGDTITARYASLPGLVRDLRANGLANALTGQKPVARRAYAAASAAFADMAENGKTAEQFSIIHMTGWSSRAV